ncbi:hypothetical protein MNBD_ALPHA06-1502 [hydrothermal vent metagenome]|uniref:COG2363 n=1 Tax=hydrothermal vent metagenome TaxID=652676 RepID=A0A3B0SHI2_9ZZZZ
MSNKLHRILGSIAALAGAAGVGLLSFAAHGTSDEISASRLHTAGLILLIHALATLVSLGQNNKWPALLFLPGALLFALAMILFVFAPGMYVQGLAPTSGIALLAGWLVLAWSKYAD